METCYPGEIPSTIFISHNHSDHAGELPVVLAVEGRGSHLRLKALVFRFCHEEQSERPAKTAANVRHRRDRSAGQVGASGCFASHVAWDCRDTGRLQVYRMHEMRSVGRDMSDFAAWVPAPEGELVTVQSEAATPLSGVHFDFLRRLCL